MLYYIILGVVCWDFVWSGYTPTNEQKHALYTPGQIYDEAWLILAKQAQQSLVGSLCPSKIHWAYPIFNSSYRRIVILGHNITTIKKATCHIFSRTLIIFCGLIRWLKEGIMIRPPSRNNWSISHQSETNASIRN